MTNLASSASTDPRHTALGPSASPTRLPRAWLSELRPLQKGIRETERLPAEEATRVAYFLKQG